MLAVCVVWGVVALYLAPPFLMILVSATVAGYILVITPLHLPYVNRRFLPNEIQPPLLRQVGLALCSLFYGWFGTMALIHRVIGPLLGAELRGTPGRRQRSVSSRNATERSRTRVSHATALKT